MPDLIGMRIRDQTSGLVVVEITDRLTRIIGTFNTGSGAGSMNVPDFSLGTGFACILEAPDPVNNLSNTWRFPRVTISGTTMSWDFPGQSGTNVACDVVYGVY
ncbi:hypothetical protein [Pseudomonas phage Almagne]|nr:hypothetical protein [Pseudomonas phage Almagne]